MGLFDLINGIGDLASGAAPSRPAWGCAAPLLVIFIAVVALHALGYL